MRNVLFGLLVVTLVMTTATVGCRKKTKKKGGPTPTPTASLSIDVADDAGGMIKPGESMDVKVTITPKDLKKGIKLKIEGLPEGVTSDKAEADLAKDATEHTFKLTADKKAKEAKKTKVTVTGSSEGADSSTDTFEVGVAKAAKPKPKKMPALTVDAEKDSYTVKKGKDVSVKVTITRKDYDGEVTLKVAGMNKKVTLAKGQKDTVKLAKDKTEATFAFTGADEAEVEITVTASADDVPEDATDKFKIKVEK